MITTGADGFIATVAGSAVHDLADLRRRLASLAWDATIRAVVLDLTAGTGADLAQVEAAELRELERVDLPVVAAVDGQVAGPALDLALGADIRIATLETVFRFGAVGTRRQMALLRQRGCVEVLRLGGVVDAEAALKLGLVGGLFPADGVLAEAQRLAEVIASRGPIATRFAKEAIWRGIEIPLEHALRFETDLTLLLQTTKDRAEGVRAFLEKRPPRFTGD
jgi:enoyl-CoA hydratase/carnithine racemase